MYIDKIGETLSNQDKGIGVTDDALDYLVKVGFSLKYGARFSKRTIDEKVKMPITLNWKEGSQFIVDIENGNLSVSWN